MNQGRNRGAFERSILRYCEVTLQCAYADSQGRPLGGASGALAPGADFEGGAEKVVTDRPHVNIAHSERDGT
jgi:hypothetical protein